MSPEERAGREAVFKSDRFRVISYSRTTASFDRKTGAIVKQTSGLAPLVTTARIRSPSQSANNLAHVSSYARGRYRGSVGNPPDFNMADLTPNVGVNWDFYETSSNIYSYMDYGWLTATISHAKPLKGDPTIVVFTYFHTWKGISYAVSFGSSGPSVTISPVDSVTSTVVSKTFND